MKRPREPEDSGFPDAEEPAADSGMSAPTAKLPELDLAQPEVNITCSLPPHQEAIAFTSYAEYEAHYSSVHTNRCAECKKNFPSAYFLDIHIEERHDSWMAVRRDRGERTVSCRVTLAIQPGSLTYVYSSPALSKDATKKRTATEQDDFT